MPAAGILLLQERKSFVEKRGAPAPVKKRFRCVTVATLVVVIERDNHKVTSAFLCVLPFVLVREEMI